MEQSVEITPPANSPETVETLVLRRLLAELGRAQSPYAMEAVPHPRQRVWVRSTLALAWTLSIVLCIVIVKYIDRQPTSQMASGQLRSIDNLAGAINTQNQQFYQMVHSLESLAGAVSTSALKAAAAQAVQAGLSRPVFREPVLRRPVLSERERDPRPTAFQPGAPPVTLMPAQLPMTLRPEQPVQTLISSGHHHQPIESVVATNNVVVHHNESGIMDYWLVPRSFSGAMLMVKVVPISQNSLGTFVHGVEDSTDYVVTPSGDWLVASGAGK